MKHCYVHVEGEKMGIRQQCEGIFVHNGFPAHEKNL